MVAWGGEINIRIGYELFYSFILENLKPGTQTQNNTGLNRVAGLREQLVWCLRRMFRRQLFKHE